MTNPEVHEDLRQVARERHVHFEVEPEVLIRGAERVKVGFLVRLWGVHPKAARAMPGCPLCLTLVEDLRRIAEHVVPPPGRAATSTLEPFRPVLYESRVVPSADEVSLAIRIFHREDYEQPVDACEEQCLKEIRGRLRELGVAER